MRLGNIFLQIRISFLQLHIVKKSTERNGNGYVGFRSMYGKFIIRDEFFTAIDGAIPAIYVSYCLVFRIIMYRHIILCIYFLTYIEVILWTHTNCCPGFKRCRYNDKINITKAHNFMQLSYYVIAQIIWWMHNFRILLNGAYVWMLAGYYARSTSYFNRLPKKGDVLYSSVCFFCDKNIIVPKVHPHCAPKHAQVKTI